MPFDILAYRLQQNIGRVTQNADVLDPRFLVSAVRAVCPVDMF